MHINCPETLQNLLLQYFAAYHTQDTPALEKFCLLGEITSEASELEDVELIRRIKLALSEIRFNTLLTHEMLHEILDGTFVITQDSSTVSEIPTDMFIKSTFSSLLSADVVYTTKKCKTPYTLTSDLVVLGGKFITDTLDKDILISLLVRLTDDSGASKEVLRTIKKLPTDLATRIVHHFRSEFGDFLIKG